MQDNTARSQYCKEHLENPKVGNTARSQTARSLQTSTCLDREY